MKSALLFFALVVSSFAVHAAESVTITISSAQADAEAMARTGVLRHCGRSGGILEGIGMSSVSADAALRRCCYWGRPYREIGIARSRSGVYFAVVRYK